MSVAAVSWIVALVGLLIVEAWALAKKRELLSHVVWRVSRQWPLLPFLAGVVAGHFWW